MPGDLLQSIGKGGKVNLRENYRQQVHRRLDGFGCHRTFRRFSVSFAHSLQEGRLVTPVVNQHRLLDGFEDAKEFPPNLPLVRDGVRPQAVLDGGFAVADAHADEVVEIAVGQALDIQIDGRAFDLQFRAADDVDFLLPNRQRLQRVVIFLPFVAQSAWADGVAGMCRRVA